MIVSDLVPETVPLGVYVTEHEPATRVQGEVTKVPVPELVKLTVPVGVIAVGGEVSATVTVHVVAWLRATVDGVQLTVVDVVRSVTVTVVVALAGALWFVSPA